MTDFDQALQEFIFQLYLNKDSLEEIQKLPRREGHEAVEDWLKGYSNIVGDAGFSLREQSQAYSEFVESYRDIYGEEPVDTYADVVKAFGWFDALKPIQRAYNMQSYGWPTILTQGWVADVIQDCLSVTNELIDELEDIEEDFDFGLV